MEKTARFLKEEEIRYEQIHLLPYHDTGRGKYTHLGRTYEGSSFETPPKERMEELRTISGVAGSRTGENRRMRAWKSGE